MVVNRSLEKEVSLFKYLPEGTHIRRNDLASVVYAMELNSIHEFSHPAEDRPIWDSGPKAASFSTLFVTTPKRVFVKSSFKLGSPRVVSRVTWMPLLEHGVAAKVAQTILGHGSIAMTLDTYSHVSTDLEKQAIAKLSEALTIGLQ
jgi:integrase